MMDGLKKAIVAKIEVRHNMLPLNYSRMTILNVLVKIRLLEIATCYRSSRPEVFYKEGVLKNFATFARKNLCWGLLFNKVAGLRL